MYKYPFIWLYLLVCFCIGKSNGQTLNFRNYSVNHGLASSTVYSVFQDSKGFIWFATDGGVNRFDGRTFELYTIDNGLSDNEVLQIAEDSKGRIWFLTLNGKLSFYFNRKIHNPENNELLRKTTSRGSFVSFYEDSRKQKWFSTNQNKLIVINHKDEVRTYSPKHYSLTDAFIFENSNRQIAAFTRDHLLVLNNKGFQKQELSELPLSPRAVFRNKTSKSLFYLSKTGLVNYKNTYNHIVNFLPENVISNASSSFIIDKNNTIWFGTLGSGIFEFNSGNKKAKHHLKENLITDILQDIQGNLWVSTIGNGAYMLPSYAQTTLNYTAADGLNSKAVHSVLKVDDQIILGLRNGNIDLIQNSQIRHKSPKQKSYNPVKSLQYDKKNKSVWFASNNQLGQFKMNSGELRFLQEEKNRSYSIKDFSLSRSGKVALAMASGIYLIADKDSLVFNTKKETLPIQNLENRAFSVHYDSAERLWFANINGLFCRYKSVSLFQSNDKISQRITDIAELPDKSIVCSTYGYGVFIIKNFKRTRIIGTKDGLLSNVCKKVFVSGNKVWLVTGKGISLIDFDNNAKVSNFGTDHGLSTSEVNDLVVENDTVYAATNKGLSIFIARQNTKQGNPPKVYFNQLIANKTPVETDTIISLPYQKNNITVNFIALDFEHPTSVKYSYKFIPEAKWNETNNNTIEFASLQPGRYQLQIRAKSINSDWSKPIQIQFTINPPFWKTWWFLLIGSVVLGYLFFYIINKYYKRKRTKENEQLITKTRIISLEQQALQAMMNPHFVFNVMNSIQYFINTKDNTMANQALTGFARLLRKNLENCNKSYITIEEEVSYLALYLSLEKMRFGDRMNYSIVIDKEIDKETTYIPSMLLQPFVENSIWHGLMPKESNGNISVSINLIEEFLLEIKIEDDGIGIDNSLQQKNEGHISRGMHLTRERINLLNKFKEKPIEIKVTQLEPEGTQVVIMIPILPFTQ